MLNVIQYELDPKGTSVDNLVQGEVHTLPASKKYRAISPIKGIFFTNSVKIKKAGTQEFLTTGLDFIFVELYQSLTLKYGKELAGVILIKNPDIEGDVEIQYQVLGSSFNDSTEHIANFINQKSDRVFDIPNWNELLRPSFFLPLSTVHELGTDYGFEYVSFAIERIRSTIMGSDIASYDYIVNYIKEFLNNVINLVDTEVNVNMKQVLNSYSQQFTKELAKLDQVVNLPVSDIDEGRIYGLKATTYEAASDNKYIITSTLSGFKETLYNYFISTDMTSIGKFKGVLAIPSLTTMYNMVNGARYVFDSLEGAQLANLPYELKAYPDPTASDTKWVVYKLLNIDEQRGGVFAFYSLKTSEIYTAILTTTSSGTASISWLKHITRKDADSYIQTLVDHMEDLNNPHGTLKFHAGLGEVENLATVTREDVICRKPVRKYVTYDALLLFWKVFLKDVKQLGDEEDPDAEITVAERFRLIFAPCGPCGTPAYTPPDPTPSKPLPVDPRDKLYAVWCNKYDKYGRFADGFGGSYEKLVEEKSEDCLFKKDENYKERGTLLNSYCEGTTLYGRYANGKGSFYVGVIQENSSTCGGINTSNYTLIEIRDADNVLYGYGFSTQSTPADPDATVMLTDPDGDGICYIFPNPKASTSQGLEATIELRDAEGQVLGYAIKPQ